tara:strand:- start:1027 stop:1239 length:213 start_codon:yes stop_codon:yes gene_type:complete
MNIGDLVKLKGFSLTDQNEIPYGIVSVDLGLNKYKVKWLNNDLVSRWALPAIMPKEKLEIVNSVAKALNS